MILQPSAPHIFLVGIPYSVPPLPNLSSNSFLEKKGSEGEDEERGL